MLGSGHKILIAISESKPSLPYTLPRHRHLNLAKNLFNIPHLAEESSSGNPECKLLKLCDCSQTYKSQASYCGSGTYGEIKHCIVRCARFIMAPIHFDNFWSQASGYYNLTHCEVLCSWHNTNKA